MQKPTRRVELGFNCELKSTICTCPTPDLSSRRAKSTDNWKHIPSTTQHKPLIKHNDAGVKDVQQRATSRFHDTLMMPINNSRVKGSRKKTGGGVARSPESVFSSANLECTHTLGGSRKLEQKDGASPRTSSVSSPSPPQLPFEPGYFWGLSVCAYVRAVVCALVYLGHAL